MGKCSYEQSLGRPRRRQGVSLGSCVLDASGRELLSRKVENDEADILRLIDEALSLAEEVLWAVDQPGGGAALLLALLWERDQRVLYIPGLTVDRARDTYRGESKTDARDARVIADQARMRLDLSEHRAGEEEIVELQLLLGRRRDLITDQNRTITRLRERRSCRCFLLWSGLWI